MSDNQYGVLAGLTVYAVPQVLAATIPVSLLSTQVGTLVKLVRVLMLGPVVLIFSLIAPRLPPEPGCCTEKGRTARIHQAGAVVHPRIPGSGDLSFPRPDPECGRQAAKPSSRAS